MHLSRRLLVSFLSLACTFVAAGADSAPRPVVVATNTILADITRTIAGDDAVVRCLVQPGIDLHGFEPRPADVAVLSRAVLVVANGAGLEPWLDRLVAGAGFRGTVVQASATCPLVEGGCTHADGHDHAHHDHGEAGTIDPHAWQDAANGIRYVAAIRDGLAAADPAHAEGYVARAGRLIAELEEIDREIRERFARLPTERRRILVSHDAMAYFGRAYGVEIVALHGLDFLQEPDARQIAALVDELRAKKIRAIFVEAVSNPKMLEQLARDTGVSLGGELFTGSVGPAGSPGATYPGMLRENAARIAAALEQP